MEAVEVVGKIMSDAQAEADKVLAAAREQQEAEQARVDKHLAEYEAQTEELKNKAAAEKKEHMLAAARMEIAKELLTEKRAILDEVFEKASERVRNMPADEYDEVVGKLIKEAVETGNEEVLIGRDEKRINQDFIKQINRELGPGYNGNLRLSDKRLPISGGFVLRRGKIMTNASLEVLLSEAREKLETELAKSLFGA